MFKDKIKLIKNLFNKEGSNKKQIENLVFFLIILIITVIAINIIWKEDKIPNKDTNNSSTNKELVLFDEETPSSTVTDESGLENKLETILSNLYGAGNVKVLLTYSQSSEIVVLYNEKINESLTEETDKNGGVRTIEEKDNSKEVVYNKNQNGEETPITQKVIMPQIEGAIILAQGANSAEVKNNIILAVEAVTGLSSHKIQVFQLNY